MPLRDRSGQRWQPSNRPYVVAATKACSRFIGTCRDLWCTHSTYMFNEACLGCLMRFGFIGSRPSIWYPFRPFPLHTHLFSSFLSCPPVFMSFISSFLSFARTLVPALACTCTTTCALNRWVSLFVPVHLVPLSSQPPTPLSRPVLLLCLHSFVSRARARAHLP